MPIAMHRRSLLVTAAALPLLTGCETIKGLFGGTTATANGPAVSAVNFVGSVVDKLISEVGTFVSASTLATIQSYETQIKDAATKLAGAADASTTAGTGKTVVNYVDAVINILTGVKQIPAGIQTVLTNLSAYLPELELLLGLVGVRRAMARGIPPEQAKQNLQAYLARR
jgi:hypothetical protein